MRRYVTVGKIDVHLGFLTLLCIILLLSSALAIIYYTKTVDHQATILTDGKIQTYSDSGCTVALDSYNWGSFNTTSGDMTKYVDLYLKNIGNVAVNVTWIATEFTSYNGTESQYESSSWTLYLVKVDAGETRIKPENDTTPDKIYLLSGETVHMKFYLTALDNSPPESLAFQTSFNSRDN